MRISSARECWEIKRPVLWSRWLEFGSASRSSESRSPARPSPAPRRYPLLAMAFTAPSSSSTSPDLHGRSSWTLHDIGPEGLAALETYKQKDGSKGECHLSFHSILRSFNGFILNGHQSRRTLQSSRQCTHHETKFLQDHVGESIPDRHSVLAEGDRLESWRSAREHLLSFTSFIYYDRSVGVVVTDTNLV